MKILVTGGAGYLGSIVCQTLLDAGHSVRALDSLMYGGGALLGLAGRDRFEFVRADLRDPEATRAALSGAEGVVHLAAIVGDPACARQPDAARDINTRASLRLLEDARESGARRLIFASTCSNYGKMADTSVPATEDNELRPVSLYAESKVAVEKALLELPASPLAATVLRFATLYGLSPRMRFDLTVNQFVMEMIVKRDLVVYGEQFWRPYVHVRDAARAIQSVLESDPSRVAASVFNVGSTGENYRKVDLVAMMNERIPGVAVRTVHKDEDPRDYRVSFEKIRNDLGFEVSRRVPDGIAEIAMAVESGLISEPTAPAHYNVSP